MAEADRIAAALRYQQELEEAQRPVYGNPNLAKQGRRMNLPARQMPGPMTAFGTQAVSLDPQPDQGYGTMAAEMALGFVPGVGQAMAARDIERARRDNDPIGMGMAATSFVPFGKLIGALRGRKQMGPVSELDVWHGTPHRFPPTAKNPLGEFDPTKIGTGEGAQAYGVGAAYLAEAKDLAKHYRDVLAIDPRDSINSVRAALSPTGRGQYWGAGENRAKLDDIYFEMQRHPNLQPYLNDSAFKKDIQKIIDGTNPDGTVTDEAINILRRLDKTMPKPSGQLYKVDLADEQIPKMLDWDKPLKEQKTILDLLAAKLEGTKVGDALGVYKGNIPLLSLSGGNMAGATPASAIGRDFLRHLGDIARKYDGNELNQIFKANGGKQDAAVSQFLQQNGITGIKYLDAGSRGAGEGTRNFIPFDPEHAKIIGRE